ncbi:MAG: MBG domain-containing protein, partial [Verrucomicrobiota bacterium]
AGLTSANYAIAFADGSLTINPATPTLTWGNPADMVYGTALGGAQLNATADVDGTFVYDPAGGTVLNAGNNQSLGVTFTPSDSLNYTPAKATVQINIAKATPVITWNNPADIVYGTALSGTQLNATANVGGAFAYSPASGTVLNAGNGQSLGVTCTPIDSLNYTPASASAQINVIRAPLTITADNKSKTQGLPNPPLTASYSGFVNGDNANVLTTQAALSTTANVDSAATTYPITASGAVAANYTIGYVSGTLTVVAQPALGGISASKNHFTLAWPTIAGQTYQVEYKDNLGDPAWTPLASPIPGTGNPLTVNDDNNGASHRFYRLKITQP